MKVWHLKTLYFQVWSLNPLSFHSWLLFYFLYLISSITNDLIFQVKLHITLVWHLRCRHYYIAHIETILYIKVVCLSVCPGSFRALPGPFSFFLFFFFLFFWGFGFCFLCQLNCPDFVFFFFFFFFCFVLFLS